MSRASRLRDGTITNGSQRLRLSLPAVVETRGARSAIRARGAIEISVVVPVFNEQDCIEEFHRRLTAAMAGVTDSWEVVFVDDGSRDKSFMLLTELTARDSRARLLSLSRNFGHQAAVSAGLQHAAGRAVVVIDADLQDPPELIGDLVAVWHDGAEVVHAVRTRRLGETRLKRWMARLFYRAIRRATSFDIQVDAGDFRLIDRRVVEVLLDMPERHRFIRGLTAWAGFDQRTVGYVRDARHAGTTKYPLRKQLRLAFTALTAFSLVPLQLASVLGLGIAAVSAVAMPVVIALRLLGVEGLGGQTTVLIVVMFFGGVQLTFLGLFGEYLGRINEEVRHRPLFVVRYDSLTNGASVPPDEGA